MQERSNGDESKQEQTGEKSLEDKYSSIAQELAAQMILEKGHTLTPELQAKIDQLRVSFSLREIFSNFESEGFKIPASFKLHNYIGTAFGSDHFFYFNNKYFVHLTGFTRTRYSSIETSLLHEVNHAVDHMLGELEDSENPASKVYALVIAVFALLTIEGANTLLWDRQEIHRLTMVLAVCLLVAWRYSMQSYNKNSNEISSEKAEKLSENAEFAQILQKLKTAE